MEPLTAGQIAGAAATADEVRTMPVGTVVAAVMPCLDEEEAIAAVVAGVQAQGIDEVIVVDGGSRDRTAERAVATGAKVVVETRRGYGRAVQAGIAAARKDADILLFIDGDGSDRVECIPALIAPIAAGRMAFVSGSRIRGEREKGSLSMQQIAAGQLAGFLLRMLYGVRFTDMSPFRAIRRDALEGLGMSEPSYGWNLEMLMRVSAGGLPALEIPVGQRRRVGGVSKVSGNLVPAIKAAATLVWLFVRLGWSLRGRRGAHPGRTPR